MKDIILVISNKNSSRADYFHENICSHKNIQKINILTYDKIDKFFQIKNIRNDYLKSPKFFCEKLIYNHQLSFNPFLEYFYYFFIIEKPRNIIKSREESNYYCLRLRRMYELICKCKNKMVFFDDDVYKEQTYKKIFEYLKLNPKFKIKEIKNSDSKGIFEEDTEEFYEKYRYKIINNFEENIIK